MPKAFCPQPSTTIGDEGVCGHAMPCPLHGEPRVPYCESYVAENPTGVCGHEMPCPRHSALSDGLTIDGTVPPPSLLWSSQPDVELQVLAECVAALQRLSASTGERARALRYLNSRYEPSSSPR